MQSLWQGWVHLCGLFFLLFCHAYVFLSLALLPRFPKFPPPVCGTSSLLSEVTARCTDGSGGEALL